MGNSYGMGMRNEGRTSLNGSLRPFSAPLGEHLPPLVSFALMKCVA